MVQINEIIAHLQKDELANINLINFIENNPVSSIERIKNAWIVRGKSDRNWVYIDCSDERQMLAIKERLNEQDKCFGAIEDWMMPVLTEDKNLIWDLSFTQYYLPHDMIPAEPAHQTQRLSEKDAETIFNNSDYQEYLSIEYIVERIQKGVSRGIYLDKELVAWGLTQDDGALGFLHVMDKARKKGYGSNITLSLIQDVRNTGKIPFCYIERDNYKSINLVTKLGFIEHKNCHWFEIQ